MPTRRPSKRRSEKNRVSSYQLNVFGGIERVEDLISPPPFVIEKHGVKVVGVIIPEYKMDVPGYIPEALKQARELVPETKTWGKPPWLSAKWQAERRKRNARSS